jgi:ribosomal-protein-alanine N-acetyltransferase
MSVGHQAELGYWIGEPFWNQGLCTDAGQAVVNYGFTALELIRIHSCHIKRNPASGRVMQKIGMTHEGFRRQHVRKWDVLEDLDLYGILKEDWGTANQALEATS